MEQHQRDIIIVGAALDWAFRGGYVDGKWAGEAFARLMGLTMRVEDGGMYPDRLRFSEPDADPSTQA